MKMLGIHLHGRPSSGFTLIEAVIVIIMLGIAGAAVVMLQGSMFSQRELTRDQQIGVQLQQECAERYLMIRQRLRYNHPLLNAGTYTQCADLPAFSSPLMGGTFSMAVTITAATAGGAPPNPCPTGRTCKRVTIAVSKPAGLALAPITLLLVNY